MGKSPDQIRADRAAENQGRRDSNVHSNRLSSLGGTLQDAVGPSYNPTKGHKDSYDKGWHEAKQDRKDGR